MLEPKNARSISPRGDGARAFAQIESGFTTARAAADPYTKSVIDGLSLTHEETEKLLRVISESLAIERHYHLFLWLKGEVQTFLPHEVLITAWGHFERWDLEYDVISALPGVRTEQLAACGIDPFVREVHARWTAQGRRPLVLATAEVPEHTVSCGCAMHSALRRMPSLLVHGVRDVRGGYDSLYVALGRGPFAQGRPADQLALLVGSLVSQIDSAFRRVAAMPRGNGRTGRCDWLDLSPREQEILDYICRGKSNADVARTLDISPFTVKNHVKRIYRKIGVKNRAQAATKYSEALQELKGFLDT